MLNYTFTQSLKTSTHHCLGVGLLISALLVLTACGGGDSGAQGNSPGGEPTDPSAAGSAITESLINGYRLTGIEYYGLSGTLIGSVTITYNDSANTDEWISYAEDGAVQFRDIGYFNDAGRLIKSDHYNESGIFEYSQEYTIEGGLITQRTRTTGEIVNFFYTAAGILDRREYRDNATSAANLIIDFAHGTDGQITSAVETRIAADGSQEIINRLYTFDLQGRLATQSTLLGTTGSVDWHNELIYDQFDNHIRSNFTNEFGELEQYNIYLYEPAPKPIINIQTRRNRFFL